MADRARLERLQPSLLDRLTDTAPSEQKEANAAWIVDVSRLREIIQRDLHWLLNTTNMGRRLDPEMYPQIVNSTLNYGITDVSGVTGTRGRAAEIRQAIRDAIERFEPRLMPETLEVTMREEDDVRGATIAFDIRAELWAEPVPLDLYLRTQLDITTGDVSVRRQG